MQVLVINYTESNDFGRCFYFGGFVERNIKFLDSRIENRLYFGGETKEEAINEALNYQKTLPVNCSSVKMKLFLNELKESTK